MPLAPMKGMLVTARKGGYALGAFEFWSLDSAQAVIEAAEELKLPAVILQAGYYERDHARGHGNLAKLAKIAADQTKLQVALHLDHGDKIEEVQEVLDAGYTSVMLDASAMNYADNVKITQKVVKLAAKYKASTEAELGILAGAEGVKDIKEEEAAQTDPEEAKNFVNETGVDCLAVAIGTAHGFYKTTPKINIERLKLIAAKVSVPLVLHGGSGTPEDKVRESIKYGIAKVNICTEFVAAFGKSATKSQQAPKFKYSVKSLFTESKLAGRELAKSKLKLFALK